MRYEWYVVRFKNGTFIDKSPCALSRSEADNILSLAKMNDKGFSYRVAHRNEANKLSEIVT